MDFSNFEQEETTRVNLLHPITGEATDGFITIFSADSKKYRSLLTDIKLQSKKVDRDDSEHVLATLTDSWENIDFDGEPLECTFENAKMLYQKVPSIYKQLEMAAYDSVKFMKATQTD